MGRRNFNAYETDGSGGGFRSDSRPTGRQQQQPQQQQGTGGQGWGSGYQGSGARGGRASGGGGGGRGSRFTVLEEEPAQNAGGFGGGGGNGGGGRGGGRQQQQSGGRGGGRNAPQQKANWKDVVRADETGERPMWRLTCYGHEREGPNDLEGDVSFEELRWSQLQMSLAGTAPATIAAQEAAEFKSRDQQWQALLRAPRAPSQGGPPIAAQAAPFKPEGFQTAGAFQSRGNPGPFQSTAAPNAGWAQAPPPATAFGSSPFGGTPASGFGGGAPASGFGGGAAASGGSQMGTFGAGFGSRLGAAASAAPTGQSRQGITFGGGGGNNPAVPVQFGQPQAQQQGPATHFGSGGSRPTFGAPFGGGGTPGAGFTSAPNPFQAVAPSATFQTASPVGGAPFVSAAFPGQAFGGVSPASGARTALPPQGQQSAAASQQSDGTDPWAAASFTRGNIPEEAPLAVHCQG